MNLNLLGEVYCEDAYTEKRYFYDKTKDRELYQRVKQRSTILVYPVFINNKDFQIVYEARDAKAYHKLMKEYGKKFYSFSELDNEDYVNMFKKRLDRIEQNIFHETFMEDFRCAVELGIMSTFPGVYDNSKFNRIFKGRVLNKDLILADNYVKVILDTPYITSNSKVLVKRMPEKIIEFYTKDSKCITEIKFKTTDIKEIIRLCQDLEIIEDYYLSEVFKKDFENKLNSALSLIHSGNYNESLCYRLLNVLELAMYRNDITSRLALGKDLIANVILENKSFIDNFIDRCNYYLQRDTMKYLKSIYLKSEYRGF